MSDFGGRGLVKLAVAVLGLGIALLAPSAFSATAPAKKAVAARKAGPVKKGVVLKKALPGRKPALPAKIVKTALPALAVPALPKPVQPPLPPAPSVSDGAVDERELIRMPSPARLAMRAEMRDRMAALDAVLQRLNEGKVEEAGQIAQLRLGVAVWWNHTRLPASAQPEQYMPPAMQSLALDGYRAASDFATVALTGDRHTASAMLPQLTGSCTQCHQAYRIR